MMNRRTPAKLIVSGLGVLALVTMCMPLAAIGADRMVICEEFTATW
jgi:hypothetical protein